MKKFYLVVTLFMCFFVFSLEPDAIEVNTSSGNLTQLSVHDKVTYYDCYNEPPKSYTHGLGSSINFFGFNLLYCSVTGGTQYRFSNYHDYFCMNHTDYDICSKSSSLISTYYNTMYSMGDNLIYYLESLLPDNFVKNDYFVISYVTSDNNYIDLFLSYYPGRIEYKELNGLKEFVINACSDGYSELLPDNCEDYNPTMKTYTYRFRVTTDITYVDYRNVTYQDLLDNFNFGQSIVQKYDLDNTYFVSSYFYNYFFMSNFSIFPNTNNLSYVPGYSVNSVFNLTTFEYFYIDSDTSDFFGLSYFRKYPFSAGTIGIKPLYSVLNYKTSQKPPFNGEYSQLITTHKHTHSQLQSHVLESTLYFNGSLGIVYTENGVPSLNRKGVAYSCPREQLDNFCTISLDFSGLVNPGVTLIVDSEILIDQYGLDKSVAILSPVIWYKTKDFDLYSSGAYGSYDDLTCYNCSPDENGKLPTMHVPIQDVKDYLDLVGIEFIDDTVNLIGLFSRSKSVASSILNSGIEILSLVTTLYNSFTPSVKALILMIFLVGVLVIFIRMIM